MYPIRGGDTGIVCESRTTIARTVPLPVLRPRETRFDFVRP